MRDKPIGVFDSGLGGLAVAAEIMHEMPRENIVYFSDFAHLPYGPRPVEEVRDFVEDIVDFLLAKNVKAIAIGCNTATVAALDVAKKRADPIPVVGMIEPAVEAVISNGNFKKIGVIGTAGTIKSKDYQNQFRSRNPEIRTYGHACPDLLRPLEKGEIDDQDKITKMAKECVHPLIEKQIDVLLLGCTDFTCAKEQIKQVLPSHIQLIDPAQEVAKRVKKLIESNNQTSSKSRKGDFVFYHSGEAPDRTEEFAKRIFNISINEISKVSI